MKIIGRAASPMKGRLKAYTDTGKGWGNWSIWVSREKIVSLKQSELQARASCTWDPNLYSTYDAGVPKQKAKYPHNSRLIKSLQA